MVRINIEVEDDLHKRAKLISVNTNKTLIQFINEAIRDKVNKEKK